MRQNLGNAPVSLSVYSMTPKCIMRRKTACRGAGGATGALLSIALLFFFGTKGHYPELCKHHIPPRGWEQAYIKKMMWGRCTHPLPVNMLFSASRITIGFTVYVFNNIAGLTVKQTANYIQFMPGRKPPSTDF